jgi:hypothetical protein
MKKKTKVSFREKVKFIGKKGEKTVIARVDTGAKRCSIDKKLAKEIGINNILKYKTIKSASGMTRRPIVKVKLKIKNRSIIVFCNIADRSRLKYPALIGRNVLRKGFVVEGK